MQERIRRLEYVLEISLGRVANCINELSRHAQGNNIGNTHGPTHLMELLTLAFRFVAAHAFLSSNE